ncbi:MAG: nucleotide exchange factor GrpE [Patescibacteria group bacterium]
MAESKKTKDKDQRAGEKLSECEKLRNEYLAGWQRAKADFLNYKRQEEERLSGLIKLANEGLISELLFVLDSFALLKNNLKDQDKENSKPLFLIYSQLEGILKRHGLEKIGARKGDKFDPEKHEAVEAEENGESGIILEIIADGYILNGKLIRATRVKVAK